MMCARDLAKAERLARQGKWHDGIEQMVVLEGKRLGILGLGKLGSRAAHYAKAFGMDVVAWSQNLTPEKAEAGGARYVTKDELLATSDFVSIHLALSDRTRGLIGAADLAKMKKTAILVNTSRGPIVDEAALIEALKNRTILHAGLDVYDKEPMSADHPLTKLDNVTLIPASGLRRRGELPALLRGHDQGHRGLARRQADQRPQPGRAQEGSRRRRCVQRPNDDQPDGAGEDDAGGQPFGRRQAGPASASRARARTASSAMAKNGIAVSAIR